MQQNDDLPQPPENHAQQRGNIGEIIAAEYLAQKGYRILARNWRQWRHELDVVAHLPGTLVFVEVKTRGVGGLYNPERSVGAKKRADLVEAARRYMRANPTEDECRFDVVSVRITQTGHTLEHFEDVFFPVFTVR